LRLGRPARYHRNHRQSVMTHRSGLPRPERRRPATTRRRRGIITRRRGITLRSTILITARTVTARTGAGGGGE
jgi:hypothetical protein